MFANCFAVYVAENITVDITIPTQPGPVTVKNITVDITIPTQPGPVIVKSVFGWIMIHQHIAGRPERTFLNRPWADFKNGFGLLDYDFWLGLEKMHQLSSSEPYRLRVEMQQTTTGQ